MGTGEELGCSVWWRSVGPVQQARSVQPKRPHMTIGGSWVSARPNYARTHNIQKGSTLLSQLSQLGLNPILLTLSNLQDTPYKNNKHGTYRDQSDHTLYLVLGVLPLSHHFD